MKCEQAAKLMDPYLDGELDLTACLEVEAHLASCPACGPIFEGRQSLVSLIQEKIPHHEAPPFLATRIRASLGTGELREKPGWFFAWPLPGDLVKAAFILIGLALIIGLGGILSSRGQASAQLAQEAITDHIRSLQVNHLMDVASTDQHTVKPWFAGKLDYSPPVIDLGSSGYPLIGGRLDVLDHRTVAAIIYQRRKHYINLFVWPVEGVAAGERPYEKGGYHVRRWTKAGMNYLAVSELGEKELQEFTQMIKDQVSTPLE